MAEGAVRVKGLRELSRDFKKMKGDLSEELKKSLKDAAEPVAEVAQQLALTEIRNMPRSPEWAEMRIGVTGKSVYIAPFKRRSKGRSRPKFAPLMLEQAMDPALERKADEVARRVDNMLGHLAGENGF